MVGQVRLKKSLNRFLFKVRLTMDKDFDYWNKVKKKLHERELASGLYFKEREIWWSAIGINIGHEQDGKHNNFERPILVLKVFNRELLWALPLTSKNKDGKYYSQIFYLGESYSVILSQLRLISSRRLLRKIRTLAREDFLVIKGSLRDFL